MQLILQRLRILPLCLHGSAAAYQYLGREHRGAGAPHLCWALSLLHRPRYVAGFMRTRNPPVIQGCSFDRYLGPGSHWVKELWLGYNRGQLWRSPILSARGAMGRISAWPCVA
jgi:hypothetical protein